MLIYFQCLSGHLLAISYGCLVKRTGKEGKGSAINDAWADGGGRTNEGQGEPGKIVVEEALWFEVKDNGVKKGIQGGVVCEDL